MAGALHCDSDAALLLGAEPSATPGHDLGAIAEIALEGLDVLVVERQRGLLWAGALFRHVTSAMDLVSGIGPKPAECSRVGR